MKSALLKSLPWVGPNALGLIGYLVLDAVNGPQQTDQGPIITGNMAIMWGFTAFPVLLLFMVINAIWLIKTLVSLCKGQSAAGGFFWCLAVLLLWGVVISIGVIARNSAIMF